MPNTIERQRTTNRKTNKEELEMKLQTKSVYDQKWITHEIDKAKDVLEMEYIYLTAKSYWDAAKHPDFKANLASGRLVGGKTI